MQKIKMCNLGCAQGTVVAQWLRCCATYQMVAGLIPAGVIGFFIDIKPFQSHYSPGVDSASNRNEYQEYFLGVKAAGADVTKSGSLNFLEPSGQIQACNGTDLPFRMYTHPSTQICARTNKAESFKFSKHV